MQYKCPAYSVQCVVGTFSGAVRNVHCAVCCLQCTSMTYRSQGRHHCWEQCEYSSLGTEQSPDDICVVDGYDNRPHLRDDTLVVHPLAISTVSLG